MLFGLLRGSSKLQSCLRMEHLFTTTRKRLSTFVKLSSVCFFNSTSKKISRTPLIVATRNVGFYQKLPAKDIWKGVTSVSNAGMNRGRGRGNRKARSKNLNIGQRIGVGKVNMVWPGLNSPIMRGRDVVKQESRPEDKERMEKLVKLRDGLGRFRAFRIDPLERGWSGTKLPGKKIGAPQVDGEESYEGFETIILESKIVTRMDGLLGRKRRNSMLVVTGNKNGIGGFAVAKGPTLRGVISKAKNSAGQRLMHIERDDNTVFHDFTTQFKQSKIFVHRKPPGYGLHTHRGIRAMCEVLGIKDLYAKVEGSTNIQNVTKAFFLGLLRQKTHQHLAEEKKLHVVKFVKGTYPQVVASPQNSPVRTADQISPEEELNYTIHAMDGKIPLKKKVYPRFYEKLPGWQIHLKKQLKFRNHDKIKHGLALEHGEIRSFYADKHPECVYGYRDPVEEEPELD